MLASKRAAIDDFDRASRARVRDEENNRLFAIIVDSEFTDTNKGLNPLLELLNRAGKICSMVYKRLFERKRPLFLTALNKRYSMYLDSLSSPLTIFILNEPQNHLLKQRKCSAN